MSNIQTLYDMQSNVGAKLEILMKKNNITKAELCRKTGVSRPTIDKMLSGMVTNISNYEKHLNKITETLHITQDMLMESEKINNTRIIREIMKKSKKEIFEFSNEEMKFEYRRSILTNSDYIVLSAVLELQKGNYDEIKAFMADLTNRRTTKQPLNLPSAGSTFKRPEGYFAGKLIDDCGLRGLTLRGAQVSEKHCGFVVNIGDATAKDILDLMYIVKSTVLNKFGVTLEEEVKILGED